MQLSLQGTKMKRFSALIAAVMLTLVASGAGAQSYQGNYGIVTGFSGGTLSAPLLGIDGTQTAPMYSFANATNTGMWRSGGGNLILSVSGTIALTVAPSFIAIGNVASIQVANSTGLDTAGAPWTWTDLVVVETTSATAATTQCGGHFNNAGAGAQVNITTPASAQVGCCLTMSDVGGTGGIGFIGQSGETIRLGTSTVSSTNRKVATSSAAPGAEATICKETSTLWIGHGPPQGTWAGS